MRPRHALLACALASALVAATLSCAPGRSHAGGTPTTDSPPYAGDSRLGADVTVGDPAVARFGAELFVSPTGRDTDPGTRDLPFRTPARAQTAVRALVASGLPEGGVVVWLKAGVYPTLTTLTLTEADSGDAGHPIVWAALPGERARLTGGVPVELGWGAPVDSASPMWSRLDPVARGHVVAIDLAAHGISDYGTLTPRGFGGGGKAALELFADGAPLPLARWPDPSENDPNPTPTSTALTLYGTATPDVSGDYSANGTSDGVNAYTRTAPVGGKTYHFYRTTWTYQGTVYTAWFLTTQSSGYPGNTDPWWYSYTSDFATLSPQPVAGASGTLSTHGPAAKNHGFVAVTHAIDDTSFTFVGDRPSRWAGAEEPWLHGFFKYMWADFHVALSGIDLAGQTLHLAGTPGYGIADGQPFYAENLLEEITEAGEWYLSRADGILLLWPPDAVTELVASQSDGPLVKLAGASFITLQDLDFEATRNELVEIQDGSHNRLLRCELRNAGAAAARISGSDNGAERCLVHGTGEGGFVLGGGSRVTLTAAGNFVRNTEIHAFSRWAWTYTPAVLVSGAGQVVAHNRIYDAPHTAILFSGNEHVLELNDIANVCQFSSDAGAIYTGRDWGYRGNVIRFNYIHDMSTWFEGYGVHAVYLDDCVSGIQVFGNMIHNVSGIGIEMGGGRDNLVENNVIARSGTGMTGDNRGLTAINDTPGDSWNMLERLAAGGIQYQADPWRTAYPPLAAIPNDWAQVSDPTQHWREPQGSVFSRNLGFANGHFTIESAAPGTSVFGMYQQMIDNLADQDPGFIDESGGDLALAPDSAAYTIPGFVPIPFADIGIER